MSTVAEQTMPIIGTLNESPLHAGLKVLVAEPGDEFEQTLGNYVVDIRRDQQIIEIQTGNFSSIRQKLETLLQNYAVHVVHPIAHQRWIVNQLDPENPKRRRSPVTQGLEVAWAQMVSIPSLIAHPDFSLELVLTLQDEVRVKDRSTRKKWRVLERRLLEVIDRMLIQNPRDLVRLLPASLPETFTTQDISNHSGWSIDISQQAAYCLRHSGAAEQTGKRGNALVYRLSSGT